MTIPSLVRSTQIVLANIMAQLLLIRLDCVVITIAYKVQLMQQLRVTL